MTLLELMVAIAVIALLTGGLVSGLGSATNAKLKGTTTLIASAVRSAYSLAEATAKPVRVVFDFDGRRVWIEEGSSKMLANASDSSVAGGADPATEAEKKAAEQAEKILKGPRPAKPSFKPVKASGIEDDTGAPGRELEKGIRFAEIQFAHQETPAIDGRSYLYVWPGGQTEAGYLQVTKATKDEAPDDANTMTLFVHPLTGHVRIVSGRKTMAPSSGDDASEREDRGVF